MYSACQILLIFVHKGNVHCLILLQWSHSWEFDVLANHIAMYRVRLGRCDQLTTQLAWDSIGIRWTVNAI